MAALKKLAGQTAIYGLPSIIGRLLNYLLVPLHTGIFLPERFGVITEMYSYVAFLVVFLTYGMETAYFRFQSKKENNDINVFSTVFWSLITSTSLFIVAVFFLADDIARWINYPENSEYVIWFAFIVGLDAVSSIALAKLRVEGKAFQFAGINLLSILCNIGLNLFWIAYCIPAAENGETNWFIEHLYSPHIGIGYVFLANLVASSIKFIALIPKFGPLKVKMDFSLLKQMLWYASPLLLASLAIIVNESADKIMLKWMLLEQHGLDGATKYVGIYGACYKLSIIITLFIQAFRYAAEPFFFAQERSQDAQITYAKIMKYFVIVCGFIFLGVMLFLDVLKFFIPNQAYWEGLVVVPILLFANIFLGIFYNLSIWYKLSSKTRYGAIIAGIGALITIVLNIILIPIYSYLGSAYATLICYFTMAVLSYWIGKKHYPIPYSLGRIFIYLTVPLVLYLLSDTIFNNINDWLKYGLNTLILILFLGFVYVLEKPKKGLTS